MREFTTDQTLFTSRIVEDTTGATTLERIRVRDFSRIAESRVGDVISLDGRTGIVSSAQRVTPSEVELRIHFRNISPPPPRPDHPDIYPPSEEILRRMQVQDRARRDAADRANDTIRRREEFQAMTSGLTGHITATTPNPRLEISASNTGAVGTVVSAGSWVVDGTTPIGESTQRRIDQLYTPPLPNHPEPLTLSASSFGSRSRRECMEVLRQTDKMAEMVTFIQQYLAVKVFSAIILYDQTYSVMVHDTGVNIQVTMQVRPDGALGGKRVTITAGGQSFNMAVSEFQVTSIANTVGNTPRQLTPRSEFVNYVKEAADIAARNVLTNHWATYVAAAVEPSPSEVAPKLDDETTKKIKEELLWLKAQTLKDKIVSSGKVSMVIDNIEKLISKV